MSDRARKYITIFLIAAMLIIGFLCESGIMGIIIEAIG